MGGGGGGSTNTSTTQQKQIQNFGGDINLAGMFAFNYKSGSNDYRKTIENTAKGEFTSITDQRSQGGKGGDSSVGLGLSYGGAGGLGESGGLTSGLTGGSSGGSGGMGSASNSGYSPTEMNGAGASLIQNKGIDSKWLIGGGIAVGLAYILSNRKK